MEAITQEFCELIHALNVDVFDLDTGVEDILVSEIQKSIVNICSAAVESSPSVRIFSWCQLSHTQRLRLSRLHHYGRQPLVW